MSWYIAKHNEEFFYPLTEKDKEVSKTLVKANSINLNANSYEINYYKNLKD